MANVSGGDITLDVTSVFYAINNLNNAKDNLDSLYNSLQNIDTTNMAGLNGKNAFVSNRNKVKKILHGNNKSVSDLLTDINKLKVQMCEMDSSNATLFQQLESLSNEDFGDFFDTFGEENTSGITCDDLIMMCKEEYDLLCGKISELEEKIKYYEGLPATIASLKSNYIQTQNALSTINSKESVTDLITRYETEYAEYLKHKDEYTKQLEEYYYQASAMKTNLISFLEYKCVNSTDYSTNSTSLIDSDQVDATFIFSKLGFKDSSGNIVEPKDDMEVAFYLYSKLGGQDISNYKKYVSKDVIEYYNYFTRLEDNEFSNLLYLYNTKDTDNFDLYYEHLLGNINERIGQEQAQECIDKIQNILNNASGYGNQADALQAYLNSEAGNLTPSQVNALQMAIGQYSSVGTTQLLSIDAILAIAGFEGGVTNFVDGLSNFVNGSTGEMSVEQYKSMYLMQYITELCQDEEVFKCMFPDVVYNSIYSIGNMSIPMATSALTTYLTGNPAVGKALGNALMFASVTGNATNSAKVEGHDGATAAFYGFLTGASETTLGYFLGRIPGLSKKSVSTSAFSEYLKACFSEAGEEATQQVVDIIFKTSILGEEVTGEDFKGVLEAGFYGFLVAAILNGGSVVINNIPCTLTDDNLQTLRNRYANSDFSDQQVVADFQDTIIDMSSQNDVTDTLVDNTSAVGVSQDDVLFQDNVVASENVSEIVTASNFDDIISDNYNSYGGEIGFNRDVIYVFCNFLKSQNVSDVEIMNIIDKIFTTSNIENMNAVAKLNFNYVSKGKPNNITIVQSNLQQFCEYLSDKNPSSEFMNSAINYAYSKETGNFIDAFIEYTVMQNYDDLTYSSNVSEILDNRNKTAYAKVSLGNFVLSYVRDIQIIDGIDGLNFDMVYTRKNFTSLGLGSFLFRNLLFDCKNTFSGSDIKTAYLATVLPTNTGAINFYQKTGAKVVGDISADDFMMVYDFDSLDFENNVNEVDSIQDNIVSNNSSDSIVTFQSEQDIAEYFGDSNLYLLGLLNKKRKNKEIFFKIDEFKAIKSGLYYGNADVINKALSYLNDGELQKYNELKSNENNLPQSIWISKLSSSEKLAIRDYAEYFGSQETSDLEGYDGGKSTVTITELMRAGISNGNENIDSAIEKFGTLSDEIITYRSVGLRSLTSQFGNIDTDNLSSLIGKVYTDKAYMSTSLLEKHANPVGGTKSKDVLFKITVPTDANYGAYIESLSNVSYGQLEFLIKKNSTSIIENAYLNEDGKIVIEMRLFDKTKTSDVSISLAEKVNRYNELVEITNSSEYKKYMNYSRKGYAQVLRSEFHTVEAELSTLEVELSSYINNLNSKTVVNLLNNVNNPSYILNNISEQNLRNYFLENNIKLNKVIEFANVASDPYKILSAYAGDNLQLIFNLIKELSEEKKKQAIQSIDVDTFENFIVHGNARFFDQIDDTILSMMFEKVDFNRISYVLDDNFILKLSDEHLSKFLGNVSPISILNLIENQDQNINFDSIAKIIENVSDEQYTYLFENLSSSLRVKIIEGAGLWYLGDIRFETILQYMRDEMIPRFKQLFWMVPDSKIESLLDDTYFYINISDGSLGENDGIRTKINVDDHFKSNIAAPYLYVFDTVVHESLHQLSGDGFQVREIFRGINEAVTQYLTELFMADDSYKKVTGSSECGYWRGVLAVEKLVDNGILENNALINAYMSNNIDYIKDSIMKYCDVKTYNKFISCFYHTCCSDNRDAYNELDAIISEIIGRKNIGIF